MHSEPSDATDQGVAVTPESQRLRQELRPTSKPASGLLIRGLGVQVPRGAPVIKALTWSSSPDRGLLHVHNGRLCAPCVLRSRRTVAVLVGLGFPSYRGDIALRGSDGDGG